MKCPMCKLKLASTELPVWFASYSQPDAAYICDYCQVKWYQFSLIEGDPLLINLADKPPGQRMAEFIQKRLEQGLAH